MKQRSFDIVNPYKASGPNGSGSVYTDTKEFTTRTTQYRDLTAQAAPELPKRARRTGPRKILFLLFCILVGILGTATVGVAVSRSMFKDNNSQVQTTVSIPLVDDVTEQPSDTVTSRLMFVGDVFWGRAIERAAQASGQGPSYLYSGLKAEDKANYDMWVGDMECPVTDRDIAYQTQINSLLFNCRPEYLHETAKWFDALSLANNHTDNNGGIWGLEQSRINISRAGIQHFGTYDLNKPGEICEVISAKAQSVLSGEVRIPVALCGYNLVVNRQPTDEQMADMKKFSAYMPVIAMPHMGVEYRTTAESAKEQAYRTLIDNGADIVIGAHPHVVQNSEVYNGRLIVYSTGNFLFDQQTLGAETTQTLGVGLSITVTDQHAITAYTSIGAECVVYQDDCATRLSQKLQGRPSFEVAYMFEYFDESSGVPVKASDSVSSIIKKTASIDTLTGLDTKWEEKHSGNLSDD